ncbi:nitrate/sulfonate/bicarbonate ABC transporter ATP-binding protein (plasmid) [Azospirillum argentinense]|uniref:Nitrate/sulfonate/bicarbonate ABC transporter ATP-binding protein n=1 Tax=Azospirillum argentinense TaxID=2970906 RepID=A0A2K1FZW7_9PROT|nr:ATP-binding cassette domain-containing protein [Azospirillum argentinense]PNQ98058.1 nitrate/sulfonate/bicarbonate ABC transporter ATP-binding protein [Azospirillum argentinense]
MTLETTDATPSLTLSGIGHAYLGRTVLDAVDLSLAAGEVAALVGPSGCGKSTLAHIAAGVVEPSRGRVTRRYRRHGMVFQDPRLLPWATARANIAYPLRLLGLPRRERRERVEETAKRVALDRADLDKYPVELSGGMRQRAAIARALAIDPDFIYFDEPFTALDVALKRRMQNLVIEAARGARFGALFITHDLMEAVRIAHRVVVMDAQGRGIAGTRAVPGEPGGRDDGTVYRLVAGFLTDDPLFRHIHDIDERRTP